MAAEELTTSNTPIIELAYKYGYETPEAFTKAFSRFHGFPPSFIRRGFPVSKSFASIEIAVNIPKALSMEAYDSVVIVGNLMDNAIRALHDQKNGFFSMKMQYDKGMLFLYMKNSYTGSLKKSRNLFLTTKERH